ncbi:MAG TPA: glutaredoxin domain-containing protein [Actinomycetota bacterium]|nr:glutaredoxin domain-containing protein [Actinomycetota bacterium]
MTDSTIKMYSTKWCPDCFRAKWAFEKHGVPVEVIDIDQDRSASEFVKRTNNGMMSVPTIVFPDESILTEPSARDLEVKFRELGLVG